VDKHVYYVRVLVCHVVLLLFAHHALLGTICQITSVCLNVEMVSDKTMKIVMTVTLFQVMVVLLSALLSQTTFVSRLQAQ
jgi:hypothetical protein